MAFFRQTWTLTAKNLKIVLLRHSFTTVIRALVLPIILAAFFSYARNFSVSPPEPPVGSLAFVLGVLADMPART